MHYPAPQPPSHPSATYVAPLPRRVRRVGAPLGAIIAMGTVACLLVLLFTAINPAGAVVGIALSTAALVVVVSTFVWLDRWEPEPPRLLLLAFLWGASVAAVASVALEELFKVLVSTDTNTEQVLLIAVVAPLTEELLKGAFLLLMLTGRRRNELNSLTDCLVYAGIAAIGFAWVENIVYIASGETLAQSLLTAGLRLVLGPFAHPLFTMCTGVGVYLAMNRRNVASKIGCIVAGYVGAVFLHGLWNGSSIVGVEAYLLVYFCWMVPTFGLTIWLAIASRRREQRIVAATLPSMVAGNLVSANEATWLGSIKTRKLAIAQVSGFGGAATKGVRDFAAQVVELGFVRARIDRGFGDARLFALQNEEAYWVGVARAKAPALQYLAHYRTPGV